MFGMAILEVAIGIILVFGLLSLITSAIVEIITRRLAIRSTNLRLAIEGMLDADKDDQSTSQRIYDHPLIAPLSRPGRDPSYIPRHQFARALLGTLPALIDESNGNPPEDVATLRASIAKIKNDRVRIALASLASDAEVTLKDIRSEIERWFDDTMARASGWFQRRIAKYLILVGLVLVFALNADAIQIVRTLYLTPSLRQSVVALAEEMAAEERSTEVRPAEPERVVEENIIALGPLIGWSQRDVERLSLGGPDWPVAALRWLEKVVGLSVSVIAVSLGAPFWFDLLGKVVSLRTSIREPLKVEREGAGGKGKV